MQSNKKDKQKAQEISKEILHRTKQMFLQHKNKVDRLNQQKNFGGLSNKNDKSESMYAELSELSKEIKNFLKKIRGCEKIRRERKQLYEAKLGQFTETVENLIKKKNIKIKINQHLVSLVQESERCFQAATRNLKEFQKESSAFCGKSYDCKPALERSMTEISELGFLWMNISKFDSVTNDSVKEIFLPVDYDEKIFKDIQNQIIQVWPQPVYIEKIIDNKAPPPPPEIIKDISKLQEAHENLFGFTRSQNIPKALELYKKQAEKQNPDPLALTALGTIYEEGKYVNRDIKKSVTYFMKSAKLNDPEGLYKVGKLLEKGNINSKEYFDGLYANRQSEIRGGIQYYERAAKLGHLDAITDLGYVYEKGIINNETHEFFIEPHLDFAMKYYFKAKKEDFPRAYNNLGGLYISNPNLVEEVENSNLEKGIKYLEKAVQLKYPKAFVNLGKCYENGVGVVQNIEKARAIFLQGNQIGDIQCKLEYMKTYLGCSLDDDKTMLKLVEITRQVLLIEKHNAQALYFMGLFEEKGIGMAANRQSSYYYINEAARLEYAPALTKLGDYYYSGYYVEKDYEFAQRLYEKAAEKMNSQAIVNLGVMVEKGINLSDSDPERAQDYYKKAAAMGNSNAILLLGLKQNQHHTETNQNVIKAAEMGNINAIKILNQTAAKLLPKHSKEKNTYPDALKKLSTFYVKDASTMRSTMNKN